MGRSIPRFLDEPPASPKLTAYDGEHMILYLRLLDSARGGADWREVVRILFDLDAEHDPERCRHIYESHLARARWMSDQGYRDLVRKSQRAPSE